MSSPRSKMHHFILIFGFVLLPKVATLKCYQCFGPKACNIVEECPASNTHCGVLRITSHGDKLDDVMVKSCTRPQNCINGAVNFGIVRTVFTSKCCTSDLCNIQSFPEPASSSPNGRKCHTCSKQSCNQTLNCKGSEDRCFSVLVTSGEQNMTMKGCVSADICPDGSNTQTYGAEFTCCQGDYCNSASTSSTSLLLLVAPFIPLITFS